MSSEDSLISLGAISFRRCEEVSTTRNKDLNEKYLKAIELLGRELRSHSSYVYGSVQSYCPKKSCSAAVQLWDSIAVIR